MRLRSAGAVLFLLLMTAASLQAASFIVPSDRELVHAAQGIVVATAQSSYVRAGENGMINTVYVLRVEEVIKGEIAGDEPLELVEPGGVLGDRGILVADAVKYRAGERALIFLAMTTQKEWRTWSMVLGKFNFVRDVHGTRLLMRGQDDASIFGWDAAGNTHREVARSEQKFLDFVRAEACGGSGELGYAIDESQLTWPRKAKALVNSSGFHACDYVDAVGGACGAKWKDIFDQPGGHGSVGFVLVGTQAGVNGVSGVDAGMGAWNGDSLSNVNLGDNGPGTAAYNALDGTPSIHFDDSSDTAQCGGAAIGCTFTGFSGSSFPFDGGTFLPIIDADVAFKAGFTTNQTLFNEVATHELGHAIGFRHSNQGTPSTTDAVMNSTSFGNFGANLRPWDRDAVETVYNPSPGGTCTPVGVPVPSANPTTIAPGGTSQLSATASGTTPITFTWFFAPLGNTSQQVGTGATINVSPTATASYWVRATNACSTGPVNSTTTVTVTVQCTPVTQVSASANPTSVATGGSTLLSATPNGSGPFTYQWFTGSPPSGTAISNSNFAAIQVNNLQATTTFYVEVTNACASNIRSNTVTVTVQPCTPPTTATASALPTIITAGNLTQLQVTPNGTGPYTFQWFTGTPPSGVPINGATTQSIVQAPNVTTTYFAQVSNACGGPANSNSVTVTVTQNCTPPSNAVATATATNIQAGQSSTLSVAANGTGLTFQWFTGTPPNGSAIPGQTGASLIVTPAATTTYFARVTGQCGNPSQIDSNAVTVTVTAACLDPAITTHPASTAIIAESSAKLSVVATGSPVLHYQWFEGATGDTSKPVGTDSPSFTSAPLTKKTQFWVQVRGNCSGDKRANSNTATIDVKPPRPRPVRH